MNESSLVKLTGLWKNKTKEGKQYLKGKISPTSSLLILSNQKKVKENDPDYVAFITPVIAKKRREEKEEDL